MNKPPPEAIRVDWEALQQFVTEVYAKVGLPAEDAALLARACDGVAALNQRQGGEAGDRFFLFHRARQWNPAERAWMGWERKRGKIEEFNHLLRATAPTSFTTQVGRLDILPTVRYCLTLDTDTRLPRNAGAPADRHHRPSAAPAAV